MLAKLLKIYVPRLITATILALSLVGCVNYLYQINNTKIISPLADGTTTSNSIISFLKPEKDPKILMKKIQDIVGDKWTIYSVYVKDLKSNFFMGINENNIFTAASVNKLPILSAVYYLAQKGTIDLDKIITLQQNDIQNYGTGSIRYQPTGSTYSIRTLARLMMKQSDNTAAYLLAHYVVGDKQLQELVDSWKLYQTNIENNKTSNNDMAILMEKMFRGKIANQKLTDEMLNFLTKSDFEDRISALLPNDVTVYHKTGNAIGGVHDVGIITSGQSQYYLGILTGGISDEIEATKTAGLISQAVYEFLR